jgi:hypothetical protein
VHGGATGIDQSFAEACAELGVEQEAHPARWDDLYAPGALIRENKFRGRDRPCGRPPAQIRTRRITSYGSYLGSDGAAAKGGGPARRVVQPTVPGSVSGVRHTRLTFPLVDPLPSTDSATAIGPALFARFVGTTRSSDSSDTCMSAVRLGLRRPSRDPVAAGVSEVSRFSRMEFPRMLRVSDSAALSDDSRCTPSHILPSPSPYRIGTPDEVISELNGWPACTPVERFTCGLTVAGA